MVRTTPRAQAISELSTFIALHDSDSSGSDSDDSLDKAIDFLDILSSLRYIQQTRPVCDVQEHDFTYKCSWFLRQPDVDFHKNFRMYHAEFNELAGMISSDRVFISTGNKPQAPPSFQLLVAIYRMGHEGDGCSAFQVHEKFGIGGKFPLSSCSERN
jgi:hypothetical protein